MNHYNILLKQSCPSVTFITEKFCLWKVIAIYDINLCWNYEGQVKRSFDVKPDLKHLKFE